MNRGLRVLASVLLASGLLLGAGVLYVSQAVSAKLNIVRDGETLIVDPGTTLSGLVRELETREILAQPLAFSLSARLGGAATRIKAGEYLLEPGMTGAELLQALTHGDVLIRGFTIVEGWSVSELLSALSDEEMIRMDIDLESVSAADTLMRALDYQGQHAEGQFLPETYHFVRGEKASVILQRAHNDLQVELDKAWQNRDSGLPFDTPVEALILASIVEKETAMLAERPLIAGVFVRRLQKRMRLQTDPTVIYGLGAGFDGNLTRRHLETDTPYNTYTRQGLPPTPIALAGAASIDAVMHPSPGDALYFVATGAGDGSHHFSATLEEHNKAVRDYLRQTRQNRKNP